MLSPNDLRKACEIPNDASLGGLARPQLPLLADHIEDLERTVAILRALVAEIQVAAGAVCAKATLTGKSLTGEGLGEFYWTIDRESSDALRDLSDVLALTEEKMLESGVGARSRAGSSHVNNRAGYDSGGIVRSTPRP